MNNELRMGCVLLAAGEGKRFGGNKLLAKLGDKPLLEHILTAVPKDDFCCCCIVAGDEDILALAKNHGIDGIINDRPEEGLARSIRLGIEQISDVDACMFLVCDQPMLKPDTISGMIRNYTKDTMLALSTKGKRGNPVIFPACLLGELKSLTPDQTGVDVINENAEILKLYDIDEGIELMDVDTKGDLLALNKDIL